MPARTMPTRTISRSRSHRRTHTIPVSGRLQTRIRRTANGGVGVIFRFTMSNGVQAHFCVLSSGEAMVLPTTRSRRPIVRRTNAPAARPVYRFKCIVCYEECGRTQRHDSGCPHCTVHDVRPRNGEVLARGVCKDCAEIWKQKNDGESVDCRGLTPPNLLWMYFA